MHWLRLYHPDHLPENAGMNENDSSFYNFHSPQEVCPASADQFPWDDCFMSPNSANCTLLMMPFGCL